MLLGLGGQLIIHLGRHGYFLYTKYRKQCFKYG